MGPVHRLVASSNLDARPVPTAYVRLALDTLAGEPGATRDRRLRGVGLKAGADRHWGPTLPFGDARRLLAELASDQPAGWHLRLIPRLDGATHGPLGFAALTAPDLDAALAVLVRYAQTRAPFLWLSRLERSGSCRLECHGSVELGVLRQPLLETSALAILGLATQVTGRDARECRVLLCGHPTPYTAQLEQLTRCPIRFQADAYAVEWPSAWLRSPSLFADPGMHRLSLSRCRETSHDAGAASELEVGLRQELLSLEGVSPGLEALARERHIGSRTLIRRLRNSGTSYRRILDEVRAALAAEWLRHSDLPVHAIATRLGFADPANFGRAFRAWFGVSPGRFRGDR